MMSNNLSNNHKYRELLQLTNEVFALENEYRLWLKSSTDEYISANEVNA
jgi:hypothetical protein